MLMLNTLYYLGIWHGGISKKRRPSSGCLEIQNLWTSGLTNEWDISQNWCLRTFQFKSCLCKNPFILYFWLVIIQSQCQLFFFQLSLPLTSPCLYCATCLNTLLAVISCNLIIKSLSNFCSNFFLWQPKWKMMSNTSLDAPNFDINESTPRETSFPRRALGIICQSRLVYTGNF